MTAPRKLEACGHHSHNGVRFSADFNLPPHDLRIAGETRFPQPTAEDCDVRRAVDVIGRKKHTPKNRFCSQRLKEIPTDAVSGHSLGRPVSRQVERMRLPSSKLLEILALELPIVEIGRRALLVRTARLRV